MQEADLDDRHILQIKGQAKQAGYQAFFGDTISLSLDGKSSNGRRVCILVHESCKAQDIADRKDPNIQYLLTSGRWKEVMVPINGGKAQMCVATFYGVSGASGDQSKKDETERLLACAPLRMATMKNVPYMLNMDLNIDPQKMEVLTKCIEKGICHLQYGSNNPKCSKIKKTKRVILNTTQMQ